MHRNLDKFGPHGGVIPYSCMDAITVLRKSLKDVAGYKNVGLTKSLRLRVLRLELRSVFSERARVRMSMSLLLLLVVAWVGSSCVVSCFCVGSASFLMCRQLF